MKPLPWSHSSLSGFDTCERQYEELKVLRNFQDEKNPASIWGDEVHTAMEKFLKAHVARKELLARMTPDQRIAHRTLTDGEVLPANMTQYEPYLHTFLARPGRLLAEQEYGLDINLRPCAFLGPDVWMRGIIDVLTLDGTIAWVDDHKTGKNRKKDMQQLIIFALLAFYHHPEINTAHCAFHWLQLDAVDRETFYRHQIPELWATLIPKLQKYKQAFDMGIFRAKPSGLCRKHCAVSTCEYWGSGRR
jgi:hypothetical protein